MFGFRPLAGYGLGKGSGVCASDLQIGELFPSPCGVWARKGIFDFWKRESHPWFPSPCGVWARKGFTQEPLYDGNPKS